ncbi:WSC domain-containing protein 1 [Madurella mycetomatis]|uniref:WSC domain-containing protein 1 n=1 Tax=Madurella mycetomatis TaxID=100816 RepID=A0A175W8D1_9PEZI|nr:WSC domain-containing protein 1 [Madurella mycetomatis]
MRFTVVLAALVASVAAAKDSRTFAVLQHHGRGPLTTCRADPIVSPGGPSGHVHTVMGASNFGFNATGESLRQSSCTTAKLKADLSSYWFPTLYFQDPDTGLLEQVKFYYMNVYYFFDATDDDIKAFPRGLQIVSGNAQLRTAPSTSGAAQLDPSKGPVQPVQITCPRTEFGVKSWPPGSDGSMAGIQDPHNEGSGIGFPFQDCDGYASPMRVDVHMPSCYDPSAGLTNHRNNMRFPTPAAGGKLNCPPGWIHVPHMFFETYWDTHSLRPRFEKLIGKASPFVFSNGDTTGFSAHADFIAAWDEDELQHIIDTCNAGHAGIHTCPGLRLGLTDESESCNIECPIDEQIDGKLTDLPGNNPLAGWGHGGGDVAPPPPPPPPPPPSTSQPGNDNPPPRVIVLGGSSTAPPPPTTLVPVPVPSAKSSSSPSAAEVTTRPPNPPPQSTHRAGKTKTVYETVTVWATTTVYACSNCPAPTGQASSAAADISDFKYAGCYRDSSNRVLSGKVLPKIGAVSNTACVNYCASKGFSIAGTEYGGECFCGNNLSTVEKLDESQCSMACKGEANETCGGDWALTLYTKGGAVPGATKRHAHHHYLHHARMPSRHHRR